VFVSIGATILHADLDAFFASVEQRDDPALRGRPVIVGGGVVLACSYEAKARGVRTAMGGRAALRACREAIIVPPRFEAYAQASREVFAIFRETSPEVEGISIDEAFLDVRGMERIAGWPEQIATRLRREVRETVGLPITVGVARTKHLAKVASAAAKPDGLLVVPPHRETAFLHPLPVERLWGVGEVTARKLHAAGIRRVGELAAAGEPALVELLGRAAGCRLHALAHNRDPRRVRGGRRRRSMGTQRALGRGHRSHRELDTSLMGLVDRLARRLRGADRMARTVVLRLRFADYTRATRSQTLPQATADTQPLMTIARELLATSMPLIRAQGITLIGIAFTNLSEDGAVQLALDLDPSRALDATLDSVRDRYGAAAITRAVLLGRDQGPSMPILPD
jgi:DNA polymerase-4